MSAQLRRPPGFTLVEVMVAVVISGIISISLAQMLSVGQRSADRNRIMAEMQQNDRVGIQSLSDDLRHVSYGKDPTQPSIYYAGPDSVDFVADLLDSNAGAERVSYFLSEAGDPDTPNPNDTVLMKVVRDTSGVVLFSAPQAYGVAAGGLAFRWFNGSGVELPNPAPQPELVGEVLVTLTVSASREIEGAYPQMSLSSTIYPRNLPLSPARSRPSSPGCSAPTYPNCESATLTWTTPTTNTDATPLPLSEIAYFGVYYGTDPDDLDLYTKLARTINAWTITGLSGGGTYYIAVTCVSRSGVESYRCGQAADMTSALVPEVPTNLHLVTGPGATLAWDPATLFESGETITTPVSYGIYRDVSSGFAAAEANRVATVTGVTTWADTALVDCNTYYYLVQAKACGNESDPSNEVSVSLPAPPVAPTGLVAAAGPSAGTAVLRWPPFTQRTDGTALLPDDIQLYKIYADTFPSHETYLTDVSAPADSAILSGLDPCRTWYLNVRCVDDCGHDGAYMSSAAASVTLWGDCDAADPTAPAYLNLTGSDDRVRLEWPTNTTDCDLAGYRIYYGVTSGGPYDGAFAAEGTSPITVATTDVTVGSYCVKELTGLGNCQQVYAAVTAIDRCAPAHESSASTEGNATTTCIACGVSDVCSAWATDPVGTDTAVHLELWSNTGASEILTRLTPTFSNGALVQEVWCGEPLAKVWSHDGSAGEDGGVGPQPSGTVLNIADVSVPSWALQSNGTPLKIVFGSSMSGVPMEVRFRGASGTCTATGTASPALVFDDFDDGNYSGWTAVTGTSWSVTGAELVQGSTLSSSYLMTKDGVTGLGNLTMEGKIKVTGGGYHAMYLAFRLVDQNNYYLFGVRTDYVDQVQLAKVSGGTFSTLSTYSMTLNDNQWYALHVQVTGSRVEGWIDCNKVIDFTVSGMTTTGKVGLATRRGAGRYDDLRLYAGAVLP